jgi:hypothetical protein
LLGPEFNGYFPMGWPSGERDFQRNNSSDIHKHMRNYRISLKSGWRRAMLLCIGFTMSGYSETPPATNSSRDGEMPPLTHTEVDSFFAKRFESYDRAVFISRGGEK